MANDNGVYILISPSAADQVQTEYRVIHVGDGNNIIEEIEDAGGADFPAAVSVKKHFLKATVFTDRFDANEEAERLADNYYITNPPIYRLYISTPFLKWGGTNAS